jgi:poly-beta-hydroxyalkanoate depolymerase
MNKEYEFYKAGMLKTITIKENNVGKSYETIEFTIKNKLTDEHGHLVIDSGHTSFFEPREFKDFFEPIINDLKVRFDNANSIQK